MEMLSQLKQDAHVGDLRGAGGGDLRHRRYLNPLAPPNTDLAEFQKRQSRGHLRENLKLLTEARSPVAETVTQQILRQNRGRKACDRPVVKAKKKKAEGMVFTEEDFQRFQQEYFGS
ncbi:active regulator of SIRT1-like [Sorex araneus]|uniref:active regulator of SIRT1-like n=1 Tax=Sorex araneus TaxID=42254 RepID=UPI002433FB7F|nr:active regulator of SIRT1-like [Sorex araneus]